MSQSLFDQLIASQELTIAMLSVAPDDTAARVGAWDRRDIAGHLAAAERDCYEPRIHAIAAGMHPEFDYFSNDDTDFAVVELGPVLDEWRATRARIIEFVKGLTGEQLQMTGHHERYGEVTIERYLEIALEHDREHLRGLERLAGEPIR